MATAMVGREVEVEVVDDEAEFDRHLRKWYGITLDELDRRRRETEAEIASGEIVPQTIEEIAAEFGLSLDEIEKYSGFDDDFEEDDD